MTGETQFISRLAVRSIESVRITGREYGVVLGTVRRVATCAVIVGNRPMRVSKIAHEVFHIRDFADRRINGFVVTSKAHIFLAETEQDVIITGVGKMAIQAALIFFHYAMLIGRIRHDLFDVIMARIAELGNFLT